MIDDPFGAVEVDEDPFATPEDVKTGKSFTPTPSLEQLERKLLILVPRKFEEDAPVPEAFAKNPGEVRERYTVDMVVLGSGAFTFQYNAKIEGSDGREPRDFTVDLPHLFTDVWRVEASIIGQLRKVDGTQRPMLLGVLRRGPQSKDRQAGKTFEDIEAAFEAWRKNPRGATPRFSWQIDVDVTPEQKAAATAWYRSAVQDGFKL